MVRRWIGIEDQVGRQFGCGLVVDARALCPAPAGQSLPGNVGCFFDGLADAPDPGQGLELLGPGHGDDVAEAELLEQAAEVSVLPISFISGDPGGGLKFPRELGHSMSTLRGRDLARAADVFPKG